MNAAESFNKLEYNRHNANLICFVYMCAYVCNNAICHELVFAFMIRWKSFGMAATERKSKQ